MPFVRWGVAWLILPAVLLASLGGAVAVRLGYGAAHGVGYTLVGVGVVLAFATGASRGSMGGAGLGDRDC